MPFHYPVFEYGKLERRKEREADLFAYIAWSASLSTEVDSEGIQSVIEQERIKSGSTVHLPCPLSSLFPGYDIQRRFSHWAFGSWKGTGTNSLSERREWESAPSYHSSGEFNKTWSCCNIMTILFQGLSHFYVLVCIQYDTRKLASFPGFFHHQHLIACSMEKNGGGRKSHMHDLFQGLSQFCFLVCIQSRAHKNGGLE